jgi:hypothetical protein
MLWRLDGVVDQAWKQVDDPCRAIKIVALTGQLCATDQLTPDRERTRYSKNASGGWARARTIVSHGPGERSAAQAEYDRSRAAGLVTEAPEISSIEYRSAQAACRFTVHFWGTAILFPNSDWRLLRRNLHL